MLETRAIRYKLPCWCDEISVGIYLLSVTRQYSKKVKIAISNAYILTSLLIYFDVGFSNLIK